ncbi:MAG: hypothetical protein ACI36Z_01375 [Alloprevotella sp.]
MSIVIAYMAAVIAALCMLNYLMVRKARRIKDRKIPVVNDDCFRAYQEAVRVIRQRVMTLSGLDSMTAMQDRLGFALDDDLKDYYPAIAMIRLCHLSGYEVEFRPMRTEHSPIEEGEIVIRMTEEEREGSL